MTDTLEANPFDPLAQMFPDERFDEIGALFDAGMEVESGEDQWKLNGLAMLVTCLEDRIGDDPDIDDTTLGVPIMVKMQALQAAYYLGEQASRMERRSCRSPK